MAESRRGLWGQWAAEGDKVLAWRIGPLALRARWRSGEWRLGYAWQAEAAAGWEGLEAAEDALEEGHAVERHVVRDAPRSLALRPALADLPVVSSPRLPLFLAPGERATLYVGTPLWLRLTVGRRDTPLRELPVRPPKLTWFGASTQEGEACYSTRTTAVLDRDGLRPSVERAATPVTVRNRTETPFQLERLKLPVPWLSLFSDRDGMLWTERVTMTREEESGLAEVEIRSGPPAEAAEAERLCGPRESRQDRSLVRVFSSLFLG